MKLLTRFSNFVRASTQPDEAAEEVAAENRRLCDTIAAIEPRLQFLQSQVEYTASRRAAGHIFEFDYAYRPRVRRWDRLRGGNLYEKMISARRELYTETLRSFAQFREDFVRISVHEPQSPFDPFWDNGWFAALDAVCLYGLVARNNPRLYLEVGSGNSTKFVHRAVKDHGLRTKIVSIDPFPRAEIDTLCDEVIRERFEDIDPEKLKDLESGDIVFIDNSHRSFQNSDVTVFFSEVLPLLCPGVIWGVHDIFLPCDYPESWAERMYNEQYLLMAYLAGGAGGDQIEFPVAYMAGQGELVAEFLARMPSELPWSNVPFAGGAFWMRKGPFPA